MKKKKVAMLLVLAVIATTAPIKVFAADTNRNQLLSASEAIVTDVTLLDASTEFEKVASAGVNSQNVVSVGEGYLLEFKVNNQYPGGFLGEFVITNTGDKAIENWSIQCDFPEEIITIWNGKIVLKNGSNCMIKNGEFNQDIAPGESIIIGLSGKCGDVVNMPSNLELILNKRVLDEEEYEISFKVLSDWQSAFTGEFRIENKTNKTIEDWELEFDFDKELDYIWGLDILSHEGNHYVVKNSGWNQNIKAGTTTIFGFQGHSGNVTEMPTNFILRDLTPGNQGEITTPEEPEIPEQPEEPGIPEQPEQPEVPEEPNDEDLVYNDYTDVYEYYGDL